MFSKKIFWKFAVGAVVLPGFLGFGVAQASVTEELDKQPYSQEINQNLVNFTQTPDIQHLEVDNFSLEVEPELEIGTEVDNEDLEQNKTHYHHKHHHHKKRRHYYKKYRRPCRTRRYYRPKKVYYRKRRSRNYHHNNVNYRRYPKKHHNRNYYGY